MLYRELFLIVCCLKLVQNLEIEIDEVNLEPVILPLLDGEDENNIKPLDPLENQEIPEGLCSGARDASERRECTRAFIMGNDAHIGDETIRNASRDRGGKGRLSKTSRDPQELGDCMDMTCVALFLTGNERRPGFSYKGLSFDRIERKEYRQLSEMERDRFVNALNQVKKKGIYDDWVEIHRSMSDRKTAHQGANFLPWHREHLKRLELELRKIDPSVSIPYWDSSLDAKLPQSTDSIIWSSELLGNPYGPVVTGPFGKWITDNKTPINRAVGTFEDSHPFTISGIQSIFEFTRIDDILSQSKQISNSNCRTYNYEWLDTQHNHVHNYIGGDMMSPREAARDPIFIMHHAFVDLIWEYWRMTKQSLSERERDYPRDSDCLSQSNRANSQMWPFEKRNIDGLSNDYTNNLYTYHPPPTCSSLRRDCGSQYLFCYENGRNSAQCVAKIRLGGNCKGFSSDDDICYEGSCINGKCLPKGLRTRNGGEPKVFLPTKSSDEGCVDRHPCCPIYADPETDHCHHRSIQEICPASCRLCIPNFYWPKRECSDRLRNCALIKQKGGCRYQEYLANCRATCGLCGQSCSLKVSRFPGH